MIYDLNKFDTKLKKKIAYMINKIDESKDIVQQREPIVNTILKEWNDINNIQISITLKNLIYTNHLLSILKELAFKHNIKQLKILKLHALLPF